MLAGFFERGIFYGLNVSRTAKSVKRIFRLPKVKFIMLQWERYNMLGYLGIAKSEGIVHFKVAVAFCQRCFV